MPGVCRDGVEGQGRLPACNRVVSASAQPTVTGLGSPSRVARQGRSRPSTHHPWAASGDSLSFPSLDCDDASGTGRGPGPGVCGVTSQSAKGSTDSLVRDGRHVAEELPRYALQNGVPEARVPQHVPLAPVNHHHLDAIFQAGVLPPIHLQTKATQR